MAPVFEIVFVVTLVTFSAVMSVGGFLFSTNGEILPDENPIIRNINDLENGTLSIFCLITEDYAVKTGLNSSSLYWEFQNNDEVISKIPGYIIDERTSGLHVDNASDANSGTYFCYLNVLLDSVAVILGEPPKPVTRIRCVSDRFLNMTCDWCPDEVVGFVGWTLQYRINFTEPLLDCTDASNFFNCQCTLPSETFFPCSHYLMNVTTYSYEEGDISFLQSVVTDLSIVKPGPVENLDVEVLNSTSLYVSWKPDNVTDNIHKQNRIIYTVTYSQNGHSMEVSVGTDTSVTLTSLQPYTEYEVKVRSKTTTSEDIELYWSDWRSTSKRTLADAPSVGPGLPVGAVKRCPTLDKHCLEVFWQEIEASKRNGPIGGYRLTVGSDEIWVYNSESFSERIKTEPGEDVTVGVQAWTVDTVNELRHLSPKSVLWLDKTSGWLELPTLVVETNDAGETGVVWQWSYRQQPDNFTLFMCKRDASDGTKCDTSPVTVSVPGSSREYYTDGFYPDYVYALAANQDAHTSGLQNEWVRVCRYNAVPGTPDVSVSALKERSLCVSWEPVLCSADKPTGLVHNYTVYWTSGQDSGNATVGAEVTKYTIPGLLPFTVYNVTVAAMSRAGQGAAQKPHTITTLESAPEDSPRDVEVSDVTSSSLIVTWQPPQYPNGLIHTYHVTAWGGTANRSVESAGLSASVKELDGHVNYTVLVVASNNAGSSQPSNELYALTHIGAPSKMAPVILKSEEMKLKVEWEPPVPANGPIEGYMVTVSGDHDDSEVPLYRNETINSSDVEHTLVFDDWCEEFGRLMVLVVMQAFTLSEYQQILVGPASEPQETQICVVTGNLPFWVWIIVGIGVPLLLMVVIFAIVCLRKYKKDHDKLIPKPVLPDEVSYESYKVIGEDNKREMGVTNDYLQDNGEVEPDSGIRWPDACGHPRTAFSPTWEDKSVSDSSSSSNRSDDSGLKSPKDGKLQTQSDPDDVLENQNLFDLADTTNFKITDETLLPGQLSTETSGIGYAGTESYDEMDKFNKPTDDFMEYAPPLGNFCSGSHTDSDLPRKITSPVHSSTADVLPHRQEPASLDDLCAVETSFISNESSTGNEQQSSSSTNGNNTDDPSGRVLLVPDVMPFERDCSCVEMLVPSSADHELQRGNMTLSNPAELPAKDIEMGAKAAAINAQHGKFVDSSSSSIDPYSKVASKKGQSKDIIDSGSSSIDPYSKVASNREQSEGIIGSGTDVQETSIDPNKVFHSYGGSGITGDDLSDDYVRTKDSLGFNGSGGSVTITGALDSDFSSEDETSDSCEQD